MDPQQLALIPEQDLDINNDALFVSLPPMRRNNPRARQVHLDEIRRIRASNARVDVVQEDIRAREAETMRVVAERRARLQKLAEEIGLISAEFLHAKEEALASADELMQGYAYSDSSTIAALLWSIRESQLKDLINVDGRIKAALADAEREGLFEQGASYDPQFFAVAYTDISTKFQEVVAEIPNINDPQLIEVLEGISDDLASIGATVTFSVELEERDPLITRVKGMIRDGMNTDDIFDTLAGEGINEDKVNVAVTEAMFGH